MSLAPELDSSNFKPLPDKPLPELSDAEKLAVTALWSWLQAHPRPSRDEFDTVYRRVMRLVELLR